MKLERVLAVSLALSMMVGSVTAKTNTTKGAERKQNYIVQTETEQKLQNISKKYQEVETTSDSLPEEIGDSKMTTLSLTKSELDELKKTDSKVIIEKDVNVYASGMKRKFIKKKDIDMEWNKKVIDFSSKGYKKEKSNIKIAILDSGVDYANDIKLEETISLVPGEEEMSPLFMDGTGHGNSVAGLIGAEDNGEGITGINPDALIYSVRVLDDDNKAPLSRIIEGIYYCIDKKVNIINMSFGTSVYSEVLKQAIDAANDAGILVVAAAGNTGDKVEYPAAFSNVLSVGAIDSNANITDTSAKGEEVQIVAPGENVCSTGEFGDICISSGTSLAASHVSAAASILWGKDKSVSKEFIRDLLVESANYSKSKDYGVLDVSYAVENYNQFKSRFHKNDKRKKEILERNSSVIKEVKETGCVEGSWTRDEHEKLVGSGHSNVKKGARYPDTKDSVFYGKGDNPWWHGSYDTNYIASYIYATRLGEALGNSQPLDWVSCPNGLPSSAKKNMMEDTQSLANQWSLLGMTTPGKRRAFCWGMAMHTAADVFAHSVTVYIPSKKKWGYLAHGKNSENNYADDTGKYEGRHVAAKAVIKKIVAIYDDKNKTGSYKQFSGVNGTKKEYKLIDFVKNIKATTSDTISTPYSTYNISDRNKIDLNWKG